MAEVLLIHNTPSFSGSSISGNIEGVEAGATDGLVQAMIALDGSSRSVPSVSVNGIGAQVIPKTWDAAGNVITAKVVAPRNSSSGPFVLGDYAPDQSALIPSISSLGLDLMRVQMVTADGTTLSGLPFFSSESTTVKTSGPYINETIYRFRLLNTGGSAAVNRNGPACVMVVRRRSDITAGVEIDIMVSASVVSSSGNLYQTQDENPGTIFYKSIKLTNCPSGWLLHTGDVTPYYTNGSSLSVVAEVPGSVHKLHVGNSVCSRFLLGSPTLLNERVQDILARRDHGYVTGANSYYEKTAHGPQRMKLPVFPSSFTYNGQTGEDAVDALAENYRSQLVSAATTGGNNGFGTGRFEISAQGAWHPFGYANPFTPSGVGVQPQSGWLNRPKEGLASLIEVDHLMQRENVIYDAATGDWLSWSTCNNISGTFTSQSGQTINKQVGQAVFNGNPNDRNDFCWPHMIQQPDAPFMSSDFWLAPESRSWSTPNGLTALSSQFTMRAVNSTNYTRHDGSHLVRFNRGVRIAIWTIGDTMAAEMLRARFAWLTTQQQNSPLNAPSQVANSNSFSSGLYNWNLGQSLMLQNNHGEGSGNQNDGVGGMGGYGAYDRRMGHILDQVGIFAATCSSDERSIHQPYFDAAAAHAIKAASPEGFFGRQDDHRTALNGGQSPFPEDPANYGPPDVIGDSGSLNGSITQPTQQSQFCYEFHQQFILNGLFSLARSGANAVLAEGLIDIIEAHTNAIFGARPGSQGAPNYYTVLSKSVGLDINGAPPPAGLPLAWDFTSGSYNVTAREWACMTLPYLMVARPGGIGDWRDFAVQTLSNSSASSYTSDAALAAAIVAEINSNSSGKGQHATLTLGYLTYLLGQVA